MNLESFAVPLADICARAPLAPGRPLRWTVIANPTAGGFTIPPYWKKHHAALRACAEKARANPLRSDAGPSRTALGSADDSLARAGLVPTSGPGHATRIVEALLEEAAACPAERRPFYLVICAGGDGTSLEAQVALFAADQGVIADFAVLRLPLGTGNDGADAWDLADALDLLLYPTRIEKNRALRLTTATPGKGPFLAFNILSVGLDAFVTHMTNKMKGALPGDSYKLWVDIASLLYDRLYKVGPMDVKVFETPGPEAITLQEKTLLLAVGAGGHRTYGSHKRILPDDRNVCLVRQMPLLRKVALKGLFTTGEHIHKPESRLFTARRVEFTGENPILAQMDGETVLLQVTDFPAAIELTEPAIPVLKRV
jgi:diacylglycerol kinase family enzyme